MSLARAQEAAEDVERSSRALIVLTVRSLEDAGGHVSLTGLRALLVLDEVGECSIGELADRLPLSQSATSRVVDKLALAGLVSRTAHPVDRRRVAVRSTAAGRRITSRLVRHRQEAITAVVAGMPDAAIRQLRVGLREFASVAERQGATV